MSNDAYRINFLGNRNLDMLNVIAGKNRIPYEGETVPGKVPRIVDPVPLTTFLPTGSDGVSMEKEFAWIISSTIARLDDRFHWFANLIPTTLKHRYTSFTTKKSTVVSGKLLYSQI